MVVIHMTQIGDNIAARRKELNLTQEELAKRVGYKSKSTINKIELGINDIPQSKIVLFAQALHTSPGMLMGWETNEKEEENIKNSDAMSDITTRMFEDSEFFYVVDYLYKLNDKNFERAKKLLNYFFEESFNIDKD